MIGFVGISQPQATFMCDDHAKQVMDSYRRMGMPGQIVILHSDSDSARSFHSEVNQ